jgi:deoxyribonuclease-2
LFKGFQFCPIGAEMRLPLLVSLFASAFGFSCLDESGQSVDMWAALKAPKGSDYLYYDSTTNKFGASPNSMNDTTTGALTYTTKQLWNAEAYAIWNDGVPNVSNYSYSYGHTKGYFAFDTQGDGFLMIHSIPSFPVGPSDSTRYLGLGGNAYTYAQSLLCLSVSAETLNRVAYKYLLNRPNLYDTLFPIALQPTYGNISKLVNGGYSTAKLCASEILQTQSSMDFQLFAKTEEWNNDLYSACVAPLYETDLWTETWIRGSAEGPTCPTTGYDTLDIKGLDFGSTMNWSETNDHSKWAIALNKGIVCIGDINRMTTQYSRGGGTACISNSVLYLAFKNAVTGTDSC